ncbi:adenylate/guanylate cyclase domain-containing protein [Mycobacterium sp. KBS0706]|uniref:adenylate/guanylate cyclase domain-containing protein n=1 Tax=Mycobacterium sp. KBS0706 TaxID=2578109 RepID=UPI00163D5635|nr:adenylate/guanylate cyclase domain-containing protein [Mycobacterium sp. KBS0706]
MEASGSRRLAAILAADVVGYSRLVAEDEEGTLRTLGTYRAAISDLVREHGGRIFGTAGDSVVVEFASIVQAVRAAVAIQRALQRRNADLPPGKRLEYRIGINVGDVVAEGDDLLGDGVNVAARLQEIASPAGICVSGVVREQVEGKLDFYLSSVGERSLKNIPRSVPVYRVEWRAEEPVAMDALLSGRSLALPDKPSIVVLPFVNMSGDREQEYFADGVTEDIITALSHYRWFFVIARNSAFAYKGRALDVRQIARELGVRYVLEGSVRRAASRLRATAQLVDAETGRDLWAERFDRDLSDVFALQDEVTQSVVAAIEPEMQLVEGRRATRKNGGSLDAFDHCMRGIWHFQQFARDENRTAEMLLRRAIELDPNLALAHAYLARTLNARIWWGWSEDIDNEMADEVAAAARAVVLDERDPYSHYALFLAAMISLRHEQSLAAAQRAIDLSPNFALGYFALGWIRVYMGRSAEAIDPMLRNLRLNPNDRQSETFLGFVGLAQYHVGNFEDAAEYCCRALRVRQNRITLRTLLAALGQLGRHDEVASVIVKMDEVKPPQADRHWEVTMPYADPASRAFLDEGLRKAGLQI